MLAAAPRPPPALLLEEREGGHTNTHMHTYTHTHTHIYIYTHTNTPKWFEGRKRHGLRGGQSQPVTREFSVRVELCAPSDVWALTSSDSAGIVEQDVVLAAVPVLVAAARPPPALLLAQKARAREVLIPSTRVLHPD